MAEVENKVEEVKTSRKLPFVELGVNIHPGDVFFNKCRSRGYKKTVPRNV